MPFDLMAPRLRLVRVHHRVAGPLGQPLWVQVVDARTYELLFAAETVRSVSDWLHANGFTYVLGSRGVWGRGHA